MKVIKILLLLCYVILFYSCSTPSVFYKTKMSAVSIENTSTSDIEQVQIKDGEYIFDNDLFVIYWIVNTHSFDFIMQNKTNKSIKIIWDESSYVNLNNESDGVIHSGVKYIEKENQQTISIVSPNSKFSDIVVPKNNIKFGYGQWVRTSLMPMYATRTKDELLNEAKTYIGKTVKLTIAMEIGGSRKNYTFIFCIEDVKKNW